MKHAKYFEELDRGMADAVDRFLDEVSEDPEASLDPRTAHLATLAALIGCQGEEAFRAELSVALDDGVSPEEAREVVCQSVAYMGIGRSAQFARAMTDVFEERGIRDLEDIVMLPDDERIVRGSGLQAEAFGEAMRGAWKSGTVNRWLAANCFGDYYARGHLIFGDREILTLCYLLAQDGCEPQLEAHILGNINIGNGPDLLRRVVLHCLPYVGYPRSLNAIGCIARVATEHQRTSSRES